MSCWCQSPCWYPTFLQQHFRGLVSTSQQCCRPGSLHSARHTLRHTYRWAPDEQPPHNCELTMSCRVPTTGCSTCCLCRHSVLHQFLVSMSAAKPCHAACCVTGNALQSACTVQGASLTSVGARDSARLAHCRLRAFPYPVYDHKSGLAGAHCSRTHKQHTHTNTSLLCSNAAAVQLTPCVASHYICAYRVE